MKKTLFTIFTLCLLSSIILAQNTVGLLSYQPSKAYDGYNLMYPHNQPNVYLLDNCGEVVHTWEGDMDRRPGNMAYLREDGRIVMTSRHRNVADDPIWAGGGGATIEIRDWDNNIEWTYTLNDSLRRLHHDIALVEKENNQFTILAIAWEKKNLEEVLAVGRDTAVLEQGEMWPDYILEIDPLTDQIVWEWHAWDHLVQDFDDTKPNFGEIAAHPNRININYDFSGTGHPDWMHSNALDYDPINRQIILCVPTFHEFWIIDHTTSSAQAASSQGGRGGRGGDLLYRWGNPAAYNSGTAADQKLFYPHDAHFIDDHIDFFDPNFGQIAIFNNRVGENFSTVNILQPSFDMYDWSFPFAEGRYLPADFSRTEVHPIDSTLLWSTGLSSVQYLPNSNLLVCVGRFGYSFELTPEGEIVWEYRTPIRMGGFVEQGDSLTVNNNLTFRLQRLPKDYAAFTDRDLSPKGWLELNPDTEFCDRLLPVEDLLENYALQMYPNPATDMLTLKWDAGIYVDVEIFDLMGRPMLQAMRLTGGRKYIDTSNYSNGMYFIRINQKEAGRFLVMK